jgi:hypothetical protein
MKKIAFLLIIGTISFSSCKKTYQCTCVNSTATGGATTIYEIPNSTAAEAAAVCDNGNTYIQGSTQQKTCTL